MESLRLHSIIGLYHLVAVIVFCTSVYLKIEQDERLWKIVYISTSFLTLWNFTLVVAIFYGYLIYDVVNALGWYSKLMEKFKILVDYCFYSFIAPVSVFITVVFWIIWNYDKNLIFGFDGLLEELIPLWLSHILHTVISFLVILQTYHNKVYFKIRRLYFGCFFYAGLYYVWIEIMNSIFNTWPYPLLEKISNIQRHLVINFLIAVAFVIVILYNYLNRKFCQRYTSLESLSKRKLQDVEQT